MLLLSVLCASCNQSSTKSDERAPSATPPVTSTLAPTASAAVPEGKTTAAPSESAAPAAAASSLAGTWEGKYQAKRGEVEMPPKVTDKVRKADDGKTAIGAGTLSFTVEANGDVRGKNEGALGAAMLSGKTEGEDVRCMFVPDDPLAKNAMFGIFSGKREGERIVGKIRVASGDAVVVREADVELKKK